MNLSIKNLLNCNVPELALGTYGLAENVMADFEACLHLLVNDGDQPKDLGLLHIFDLVLHLVFGVLYENIIQKREELLFVEVLHRVQLHVVLPPLVEFYIGQSLFLQGLVYLCHVKGN